MKKKQSKAKRGQLYVSKVCGSFSRQVQTTIQDAKWPWSWMVLFTYPTETITIRCTRDWKTEAGARRHALRLMADWGIELED